MPLYKTILHYHSLHTFESIWIVSLCRHLFAGWAVSKECMVLVCTLHRRRGFPGPFIERWKWCRIAVINRCHPWSFLARFFFQQTNLWKSSLMNLRNGMMDGPACFFPWGLQSGSIRGTVPQFCEASPPGEFFGEKRRVRNSCGFILNLLYIFLETNIALWK